MENLNLVPIAGIILTVQPMMNECCQQIITLQNSEGIHQFIISADTYVVDMVRMRAGMTVTAFYDASLPIPLIYPPQYQAVIIGRSHANETMTVGYFDEKLLSADESLSLNISRATEVLTSNGQDYFCPIGDNVLIVYYAVTTKSIPPQTTPRKVIVMC